MAYGSSGKVGFSATRRSLKARHNLKEVVIANDGGVYAYGKASAAVVADAACTYNASTGAITATAGAATADGAAFAANEYGFVKLDSLVTDAIA